MLLAEMLRRGQAQGEIEKGMDIEIAAALLIGVMDGVKALVLRDSEVDVTKTCGLLRDLVSRFLSPTARPQTNSS
jgi:hypothetical protein